MRKQSFISSLLLFAFAIIFAHSIIPHHHYDEGATEQHQTSHNNNHHDIDDNFLAQAFSHFQHGQGDTIVYETVSPYSQYSKVNLDKDGYFSVRYIVQVLYKPPPKHLELYPYNFSSSSYSDTQFLRGPPVSLA